MPSNQSGAPLSRQAQAGVTLAEYGFLLTIIAVTGLVSVQMMGNATSHLYSGSASMEKPTLGVLAPNAMNHPPVAPLTHQYASDDWNQSAASVKLKGKGYYTIALDPNTGEPYLQLVDGTQGVATNVSSIDGSRMNTLGGVMLASQLETLAKQQTDPKMADYIGQLAYYAYYLGGAEGKLDQVPGLAPQGSYSNGNAIQDINYYRQQLSDLMQHPPEGFSANYFAQVMPLAMTVYNIAQNYQNHLGQFLDKNGKIPCDCSVGSASEATWQGYRENGRLASFGSGLGAALENSDDAKLISNDLGGAGLGSQRYDAMVSLSSLQASANQVLKDNKVQAVAVKSTFTSAQTLETMDN